MASVICEIEIQNKKATIGEDVACRSIPQTLDKEDLEPFTQEEAEGRIIFIHVADAARQGYHNIRCTPFKFHGGGGERLEYF